MSNNTFPEYLGRPFSIEQFEAKRAEVEVHLAAQGIYPTRLEWCFEYDEHVCRILWLEAILDEA